MSRRIRVKPSKGESVAGAIVGILFIFMGLFVAIPTFGAFGIIWTLVAAVITIVNGVNAFSNKGIATHEIIVEDDSRVETSNYNSSQSKEKTPEERLNTLQRLYDKGTITTFAVKPLFSNMGI